jgi:hypothetical protein
MYFVVTPLKLLFQELLLIIRWKISLQVSLENDSVFGHTRSGTNLLLIVYEDVAISVTRSLARRQDYAGISGMSFTACVFAPVTVSAILAAIGDASCDCYRLWFA